jgi:twitching motility protein PilT
MPNTSKRGGKAVLSCCGDKLFKACVKLEGSDLHLKVGTSPIVRVKGDLKPLNRPPIDVEEMVRLLIPILDDRNRRNFEE